MKLVNPRLGLEVELSENQVLNITVESPVKFSEVVYHTVSYTHLTLPTTSLV